MDAVTLVGISCPGSERLFICDKLGVLGSSCLQMYTTNFSVDSLYVYGM